MLRYQMFRQAIWTAIRFVCESSFWTTEGTDRMQQNGCNESGESHLKLKN